MKKPFDRIVGPEGEWEDPGSGGEVGGRDAAKRLCFKVDPKNGFVLDANLDMVAGDFEAETIRRIYAKGRFNTIEYGDPA